MTRRPTSRPSFNTRTQRADRDAAPGRRRRAGAAALTVAAVVALTGCSAIGRPGASTTETHDVAGATGVVLSTSGRLTIETGDEAELTVTAGENVLELLTTEVQDGVLVLGMRSGYWGRTGDIEYHLVLPEVDRIALDGSGDIQAELSTAQELDVQVRGSGGLDATDLDLDALAVSIEGSGSVTLEGRANNQDVRISGSGSVEAQSLTATNAVVLVEGSGDANLLVSGSLDATVEGSGSVHHSGGAKVTQEISGSGDVVAD